MAREEQRVPEESLLTMLEREKHAQNAYSMEKVNKLIKRNKKLESFAEHVLDMK